MDCHLVRKHPVELVLVQRTQDKPTLQGHSAGQNHIITWLLLAHLAGKQVLLVCHRLLTLL